MPAQSSFGSSTRVGTPRQDSPSALRLRWSGGAGREDASGHVIHGSVQHRRVDRRWPGERRRHERACDAAKKPPKSAGVSDWKKYTPASHTADHPEPEEQADSERMSHRAHMGLCRRVGSRRRPSVHLPCFSSAATYRSPGGSDGIGLQCVGSNSTSTLAVDIQRPCCHCPACQPACSGQNRSSVSSGSLGAVSIG